jgi:hypothetical protein
MSMVGNRAISGPFMPDDTYRIGYREASGRQLGTPCSYCRQPPGPLSISSHTASDHHERFTWPRWQVGYG